MKKKKNSKAPFSSMQNNGKVTKYQKKQKLNLNFSALTLHNKYFNKTQKPNKRSLLSGQHYEFTSKFGTVQKLIKNNIEVAKYYICSKNDILMVMTAGNALPICGSYELKLISGQINILGYDTFNNETYKVLSNELDGIMDITCIKGEALCENLKYIFIKNDVDPDIYIKLKEEFQNVRVSLLLIRRTKSIFSTIVKKTGLSYLYKKLMENYPLSKAAKQFQSSTNTIPMLKEHDSILNIPESWKMYADNLKQDLTKDFCVVVCGHRNTGKSTIVRYLCNRILSLKNVTSIGCLDIDPVKPEFSAPGNLSFSIFSLPVLGPANLNYEKMTFSVKQEVVFTSSLPSDSLSEYYAIVKYLRDASIQYKVPIIVNTTGYKKCYQTQILVNLLRIINPSHVLLLDRKDDHDSLDINLNFETVNLQTCPNGYENALQYKYHKLPAYTLKGYHSTNIGNIRVTNLLSYMLSRELNGKKNHSRSCVEISYKEYVIHNNIEKLQPSYNIMACNMKLFALCEVTQQYPVESDENGSTCISQYGNSFCNTTAKFCGFGIVLKTNPDEGKLTILISTSINFADVNALLAVGYPVPKCFIQTLFPYYYSPTKSVKDTCNFIMKWKYDTILSLSALEYCDVSKLIFSNCLENLKKGLQYLYIWRSRAAEVPIGIEMTISLLQAQLTLKDSNIDDEYKHILVHGDFCRFINVVCKIDEEGSTSSMVSLINICPVIGEYRNFLTHMTVYIDFEISEILLTKCMNWVKENYWKKNMKTMTKLLVSESSNQLENTEIQPNKNNTIKKKKDSTIEQISQEDIVTEKNTTKINVNGLIMSINHFWSLIDVKRPFISTDTNYKFDGFMLNIMEKYILHPEVVMELIVSELFLNPKRKYLSKEPVFECRCGCLIPSEVLMHIGQVFEAFIFTANSVCDHFLKTFLVKSKNNTTELKQWINLFISNIEENPACSIHSSMTLNLFSKSISWETFTILLMENTKRSMLPIAKSILLKLGERMKNGEKFLTLLNLFLGDIDPNTKIDDSIYTIEMLQK